MRIVKVHHADHGVSADVLNWAIAQFRPAGFFARALALPTEFAALPSGLYGPMAYPPCAWRRTRHPETKNPRANGWRNCGITRDPSWRIRESEAKRVQP